MNKQEFLFELRAKLTGLPQRDIDERLNFYSEMIDDRMEDGLAETDAVLAVGTVDDIVAQILDETSLLKIAKERVNNRRLKAWEIVLLVLGSPIWFSLLVAAFAVIFSLYASLWSVIISLWAAFASIIACSFGSVISGIFFVCFGNGIVGVAIIGVGLVCAGLSVFMFFGCSGATKGTILLTKKIVFAIKNGFIKKEEA